MTVTLASAWHPRGEMLRFQKLLPRLLSVYTHLCLSLPPDADTEILPTLAKLEQVSVVVTPHWSWGRHMALRKSLDVPAGHVHYADFDRLLRWVETRPEEWRRTVRRICECDCLIIGRTETAYATHPKALVSTEAISNCMVSHLLGQPVDASAGSKGFSRRAASYLIANTSPGRALGTNAEWPVLLKRAGFRIDYVEVDGLDWESADRYQDRAADAAGQRLAAEAYDADPRNWAERVAVALEIVQAGLEAEERDFSSLLWP